MLATLKRLARMVELGLLECQPVERTRATAARDSENGIPRSARAARSPQSDGEDVESVMEGGLSRAGTGLVVSRWKWRRGL
jgi:hypothetical protein